VPGFSRELPVFNERCYRSVSLLGYTGSFAAALKVNLGDLFYGKGERAGRYAEAYKDEQIYSAAHN
jgi:hypothetical protein